MGNVTPALGALGAAALMGGFVPGAGPAERPRIAIESAQDPEPSDTIDLSTDSGGELEPVEEKADAPKKARPGRAAVADAKKAEPQRRSGVNTVVLGSRISKATPAPANTPAPAPAPAPTAKPKPTHPATPEPQNDKVHGDPQPEHGNDCAPKNGNGGGHEKHCG
jgi:hypothetical protein